MRILLFFAILQMLVLACSTEVDPLVIEGRSINMLNLGDSYTYGQSVCTECGFPNQLLDTLKSATKREGKFESIAKTGWTTGDLLANISTESSFATYDIVTLLIGVNNQYQHLDFSIFETEFATLVEKAIIFAGDNKEHVFILSIPDYAFTPFGQSNGNAAQISNEINQYNSFIESYANSKGIQFINITDITREGLDNPLLVAEDQLHPSSLAYEKFVERMFEPIFSAIDQ